MSLIIEGSDCLGKTTLAKKIVKRVSEMGLPVVYSHMTRPNESVFDFFHDYKKMLNPCAVQDRFHLGGLAYHHLRISQIQLQIINSWIRSVGGLIVVLYAADDEWYRRRLENDERASILSIDAVRAGNNFFKKFDTAGRMDSDFAFNILPYGFSKDNINYVKDADIKEIVQEWLERRQLLGI